MVFIKKSRGSDCMVLLHFTTSVRKKANQHLMAFFIEQWLLQTRTLKNQLFVTTNISSSIINNVNLFFTRLLRNKCFLQSHIICRAVLLLLNNEPVFFAHFLLKFFVCHTFWQITFKDLLTLFVLSDRKKWLAQANADSRNNLVYFFIFTK